jgi:predicted Zn-dependent protease
MRPSELPAEGSAERATVLSIGAAEALAAKKEFPAAKTAYAEVVEHAPKMANLHYAYGKFLLETHDVEAAIAEFEKELARDPNHVFARLQIAAAHYRSDSAAGIPYAKRAVELDPRLPFGHYLLGLLYSDVGDGAEAIPQLEIARKAFPNDAKMYFALGNAYAKVGRKAEAAEARRRFVQLQQAAGAGDAEAQAGAQEPIAVGQQSPAPVSPR